MQHIKAIAIKFFATLAVLAVILGGFYGVSLANIFIISILLTAISYIIGDLYLLPRFENWGATLADYGLAFLVIWLLGYNLFNYTVPLLTASAISALFIAGAEYFFHQYMATRVFDQRPEGAKIGIDYQTEFSSELNSDEKREENDHDINL